MQEARQVEMRIAGRHAYPYSDVPQKQFFLCLFQEPKNPESDFDGFDAARLPRSRFVVHEGSVWRVS